MLLVRIFRTKLLKKQEKNSISLKAKFSLTKGRKCFGDPELPEKCWLHEKWCTGIIYREVKRMI